jgi:hypothetical protein
VVAHLHAGALEKVRVRAMLDRAGQAVIVALPEKENGDMADDRQLREFTCDPRHRKILVADASAEKFAELHPDLYRQVRQFIAVKNDMSEIGAWDAASSAIPIADSRVE